MALRVLIADTYGKLIGEIEPEVGPISWRLNEVGRFQFMMDRSNAKATRQFLEFGNRVLVQFDNGLPDWGGVIDTPRDWDGTRILATVYSGEHILSWRITDRSLWFNGEFVGEMFSKIIESGNSFGPTGISLGWVWTGTESHYADYHYDNLLDAVQDSICSRLSTAEFNVYPEVVDGVLGYRITLMEKLGSQHPNVALVQDRNIISASMSEQGTIVNWWDVAGGGQNWNIDRLSGHGEEYLSQGQYGLRMGSEILSDVTDQTALDYYAVAKVTDSAQPKTVYDLMVSNLAPALFADYDVGDYVTLELPSYGFGGTADLVRVMGREFDPRTGYCRLVVMNG